MSDANKPSKSERIKSELNQLVQALVPQLKDEAEALAVAVQTKAESLLTLVNDPDFDGAARDAASEALLSVGIAVTHEADATDRATVSAIASVIRIIGIATA